MRAERGVRDRGFAELADVLCGTSAYVNALADPHAQQMWMITTRSGTTRDGRQMGER